MKWRLVETVMAYENNGVNISERKKTMKINEISAIRREINEMAIGGKQWRKSKA
jgi:hypothetical protein